MYARFFPLRREAAERGECLREARLADSQRPADTGSAEAEIQGCVVINNQ